MRNLLVLTRDLEGYGKCLEAANLPDLGITLRTTAPKETALLAECDILFGDPDLCVEVLDHCPNLKWIQSTWAGVKPITDCRRSEILLTGVKDVFGKQMQEYVFAYLLYFSRQIYDYKRLQQQQSWQPIHCNNLYAQTIVILGVGSIGKEVAKMAKQFGMYVIGVARSKVECDYIDEYYAIEQHEVFAAKADYLVSLLPHTTETENVIDRTFISNLAKHCVLINAGRGQVVDEVALGDALRQGALKAAVLDVFKTEPLPANHTFWSLPNLYITQHTAAISKPEELVRIFIDNYQRYIANSSLNYLIDWEKGY
ncbi:D-2-hydroxyacid dehydrogenase [Aliiglaciecola sp. LCG003]|uniref:D-2-hydroxyacid dehydrogenase n=1 Tax=Aliiglaciecola sp. LCG003 TaxID=3053655 RepID=UPI0025738D9D|nr:D-2-hydroxyacid dehydrogenase [Aliiglaciecola sp. LCG003]WJG08899.1 D-2-hydroxyacid dehydrogenase [Aliiglaciecola sp. LCG003]